MEETLINLEHEIAAFITKDNGATVHFKYEETHNHKHRVSAYTVNNSNKEMFLLKSVETYLPKDALDDILTYVKSLKGMSSFTVKWNKNLCPSDLPIQTSYFYCHDITDVVNKFFSDKNIADYVVYEIKLNPIS